VNPEFGRPLAFPRRAFQALGVANSTGGTPSVVLLTLRLRRQVEWVPVAALVLLVVWGVAVASIVEGPNGTAGAIALSVVGVLVAVLAAAPHRVRRLVGISPVPASGRKMPPEQWELFASAAEKPESRRVIIDTTTGSVRPAAWLERMVDRSVVRSDPPAFRAWLDSWAGEDFTAEVAGCETPALAVTGALDPAISADFMRQTWLRCYVRGEVVELACAGHHAMDAVCAAIHASEGTSHAMPPKRKVDLPDHVREAALADVQLSQRVSAESEASFKIRIYLATEQGLGQSEIADRLGLSQPVISKYVRQGQELYNARQKALGNAQTRDRSDSEDPDRSGELISNG
jgi:pimeloyl-ACP methyl ester carboxylesterase